MTRRDLTWLAGGLPLFGQAGRKLPELDWHDAKSLLVEGLGFKDLKAPYDRLPARAEGVVRDAVWNLSRQPAGVAVRFTADATAVHARWALTQPQLSNPTNTAVMWSGLDLYVKTGPAQWRWLGIGRPATFPENTAALATGMPAGSREYMVYLPLHNPVTRLSIGVPKGSSMAPGTARPADRKPIVFYGTSITHGSSASRPGMTHVAILGRRLDRETINLGFGGNGRMELEVAKFLTELDPAVYVLDCLPNMTAKDIRERAAACVKLLREARPDTPILVVEDRNYTDGFLNTARRERNETNHEAMQEVYKRLQGEKVRHLHYLKADNLLGSDGEATIDGSHPTDLGFERQAIEFEKALRKILK